MAIKLNEKQSEQNIVLVNIKLVSNLSFIRNNMLLKMTHF